MRRGFDNGQLLQLAGQQFNCVTLTQLSQLRVSNSTIAGRTRPQDGSWTRILPGVVLLHRGTPTADERAQAALLYAGSEAVLTGLESLARHGMRRLPRTDRVHVLVPATRHRKSASFVIVDRTHRLPTSRSMPMPCAPVSRAIVDAGRTISDLGEVRAMVAEAVQRRAVGQAELLEEIGQSQRQRTARLRFVAREIVGGIRSAVEAEARVLMAAGGLPPALWNHDLFSADGTFIGAPDAWFDEAGLAVEIDSREFHLDPEGWERTQRRRAHFAGFGIVSLPITPARLRREPEAVVRELHRALRESRSRPRPRVLAVLRSQRAA